MTALCGWIGDALAAPDTTLASMGHKLGGANLQRSAIHAPQGALLTAALRQAPAIASDGVLHASILGNPQFADAALRQLAQQQGPAAALLAGYRQYGAKVLQQLHDRFCIVVLDLAGNKALLAVQDSGPGIADELRKRLFEPYVTTKAKGTGLGLAIVKKIVEEHHGAISIRNVEPHGARVEVELPLSATVSASV